MKQINSSSFSKTTLFIALLAVASSLWAQQKQKTIITLNLRNASLNEFIKQVEKISEFTFVYGQDVKLSHPISLKVENSSMEDLLANAFVDQPVAYEIKPPHIVLIHKQATSFPKQNKRKCTISGYVTDIASGETLIGANVLENMNRTGAATNPFGFYTLTVPEGEVAMSYSYLGYATIRMQFVLRKDTVLNVKLKSDNQLQEVIVTSDRKEAGILSTNAGAIEIPMTQIQHTPTILGEADILKTIQLMPGVQAGTEGFSGLYVRGGNADQNLVMLDGIPIYNADHLLGIFSIFQPEAVKNVTLFKGAFPARYGGRISSIVDVRTNDGNMKRSEGSLSIGSLTSKLHLEGPIAKDKTSYSFSARGVHTLLFMPFVKSLRKDNNYYFADINAKVNHRFNDRSRMFLNVYWGEDRYKWRENSDLKYSGPGETTTSQYVSRDKQRLNWGNFIAAGRWNYVFSNKLFSNATLAFNKYRMKMFGSSREIDRIDNEEQTFSYQSDYRSGIEDWSARMDFDYTPVPHHLIKFGGEGIYHTFRPETLNSKIKENHNETILTDTIYKSAGNSTLYGKEISVYAEDNFNIGKRISIDAGVHFNLFDTQGRSYYSAQPRISAKYRLGDRWITKAAFSQMTQYVHLLSSTQIALPTDLWVPITKHIQPMTADQYSAGLYYDGVKGWEFSIEGYYKKLNNVLEYQDGVSVMGNSAHWENKVEMGEGRSFGLELLIQKTIGNTTGWLAYTLSKSDRRFKNGNINNGERFPYKYDRRHYLNIVVNHQFNRKWDAAASWIFNTGGYITVPERRTVTLTPDGQVSHEAYISRRNNYRLPCSHRLNLSVNLHRFSKKGAESIWNFSIYNVYNAMNPNLVYAETKTDGSPFHPDEDAEGLAYQRIQTKIKKLTILPFIPSISYTLKF